jgi:hypothetical protein
MTLKKQPEVLSLVELQSSRELAIFRKIYDRSIRIGTTTSLGDQRYARVS